MTFAHIFVTKPSVDWIGVGVVRALLLAGVMAIGSMRLAIAAPITATYDFVATFSSGPNATVSGSVTLTYDPATRSPVQASNFMSSVLASYTPVTAGRDSFNADYLSFGNNCDVGGGCSVSYARNEFVEAFRVNDQGDVQSTLSSFLAYSDTSNLYDSITNVVTREAAAVPEPASLALLGMGVAGIAAARRRRA